ncbi:Glycosyl transferases group 1 [Methylorubrum salsuginis]|uniref:Glycosyl transferases group 1 n=2 Tax=Methylorubrum salsuginis TaxID=414703 RepID=A0A1I4MQF2_9HYPH|nr:Glycosyl transferases group 1 [Methylorubrum salsuginis]
MRRRPRVLLIAPIRPARSGNGLAMRVALFVEAAENFAELDVVVVPVAGATSAPLPPFRETTRLHEAPASPNRTLSLIGRIPVEARADALRAYGRPSLSGLLTAEAHHLVARLASTRSFDLVVVLRTYMLPLAEAVADTTALALDLDEDDLNSALSQSRIALAHGRSTRAAWLMADATAIDRMIALHEGRLAASFTSCEGDGTTLRRRHPGLRPIIVNNAVAIPRVPTRRHDGQTLLFVGAFGHLANVDGIAWFAESVVPRLHRRLPWGFRVIVAGNGPPPRVLQLNRHPRIEIVSNFESAAPLYARATIAIAPLRFGGGARTKIIEAAAHGVACVAHRASVNGKLADAGWAAGSAPDFATACAEALQDPEGRRAREASGRAIARTVYDRNAVIARLTRQLAHLVPLW